jgi:hypothetical protein
MSCVVTPNSKAGRELDKAIKEGRVVRVVFDDKTGTVRPITPTEAAKADAKMKPLLDFLDSLPKD